MTKRNLDERAEERRIKMLEINNDRLQEAAAQAMAYISQAYCGMTVHNYMEKDEIPDQLVQALRCLANGLVV